jgi:hypothetical protein
MKKILLASAVLLAGISLSHAGLHFDFRFGIPLPPPPIVFGSPPPVYVSPPVAPYYCPAPAVVYAPPALSFRFGSPYYYHPYYRGYRGYDRHWDRRGDGDRHNTWRGNRR